MTQQDPLEQLRQLLAVAPSPEFGARVRQQVSTQSSRAGWWPVGHLAAAAAAVCVVSVVMTQWGGEPDADIRPAPAVAAVSPVMTPPESPGSAPNPIVRRRRHAPAEAATVVDTFAETLVPDDQRLALERLIGAIRGGRATVPAVVADEVVDDDGRRLPRSLVIEPLKLELMAGTPAEPNKDPIKDPIK